MNYNGLTFALFGPLNNRSKGLLSGGLNHRQFPKLPKATKTFNSYSIGPAHTVQSKHNQEKVGNRTNGLFKEKIEAYVSAIKFGMHIAKS